MIIPLCKIKIHTTPKHRDWLPHFQRYDKFSVHTFIILDETPPFDSSQFGKYLNTLILERWHALDFITIPASLLSYRENICNDPIPQAQQGPISLQETLDLEPSERDIGELSQPPSTEIRSVTPPPSHPLGNPQTVFSDWLSVGRLENRRYLSNHWVSRDFKATSVFVTLRRVRSRSFSPRSAATRPHAQEEVPRVNRTRRHLRRTFAGATAAGHCPFAAGKPPPHRRRVSAAAGDFPVSHHRRWPPPATGLRRLAGRLAAGVHSYHFSTLLRGSETSGLAMLLVRACGAETFVSWTLLERAGVQRHTVLATLRIIYPYEEIRGVWTSFMLSSHCLSVVCVFSIPIPHGVTPLLLTPPIPFPFQMPPRKRVVRTQAASASREGGDEHVPPPVPPIDQDALRQMVQDAARQAAQEAVQQAVQEAARVAAQEVVRQMAAAQQGQQVPPVQAQGHQQPPIQPVPPVQVQGQQQPPIQHVPGIFQVPPPAPPVLPGQVPEVVPPVLPGQVPEVDETLMRVMRQMKTVGLETFEGTVDPGAAYKWKHRLASCLQTINCPLRLCLNIAELYLRGDALVWWDGVRSMRDGDMTYEDFLIAFDKKYFPREALHQKRNAFEHLRQGTRSIREYKREFFQLRLFAGNHFDGEDLIRRFLDGMRVDLCGRCSMVTYTSLEDLVEKAVVQEACVAEEQKYSKAPLKTRRTSEPQKRTWEQLGTPSCDKCRRHHFGECITCFNCGKMGHKSRDCRSRPFGARGVAPAAPAGQAAAAQTAPVAQGAHAAPAAAYAPGACFTCGQFGHISRFCPTKRPGAKRQAITPRKSLRRQTPADLEPSERDIGELSQPPSTEIRSVTPPPSHPLGHQCVRDVETSPEQEFQPEIRRDAPTRAGGSSARESHAPPSPPDIRGATAAGHRPFAEGKPPPHRRRVSAAAGDFPVSHHRRWPPPATGLRRLAGRLAAGVHSYHFSTLLRGSETSGLAMLLVRACGAETFVSWTLLERAGVRLTSRSDCYRIGALGVLFLLFSDFRFYDFIDISGFISFIAFMVIYWIYDFGVDF
ncbi:hypothetical protein IGI04_023331 [Brassica rapa subsp. trilocularis]|uniref:CCHC-type domain-containing protein n=1 Tax=Brassica rapa subsp. trilocularis TaxID=1813537 RepID=A0ABQ7M3K6_BRACM|nr:hypothetical protein IGI04_023331 [Brassica rapa subsp. trilocularis]